MPDVDEARSEALARGMRVWELKHAFYIHPADAFGVSLEFFGRSFHDEQTQTSFIEPLKPAAYWREEHPLGFTGLKRYSVAVSDLEAATEFFAGFVGASVLYEQAPPAAAAKAVGLSLGDSVAELISPVGAGVGAALVWIGMATVSARLCLPFAIWARHSAVSPNVASRFTPATLPTPSRSRQRTTSAYHSNSPNEGQPYPVTVRG